MTLQDAHNHLQDSALDPHRASCLAAAARAGLTAMVVNGTAESDWPAVLDLAQTHPGVVRPSLGLHPWDVAGRSPDWLTVLERLLRDHPRAAVGEIGLDRWILESARAGDPRLPPGPPPPLEVQQAAFLDQLALARDLDRAVTIHCLHAWGALRDALAAAPRPPRGFLLHAYSGPAELVPWFAARGACFSFNTAFLDPRRTARRAVFAAIPEDLLLVETDAPAMPPPASAIRDPLPPGPDGAPLNSPAHLPAALAGLAALRSTTTTALAPILTATFARLFG